jgi:outer membrane protein
MPRRTCFLAAVAAAALAGNAARAQNLLDQLVGRAGGLRSADVAERALSTSPGLLQSREDVLAAAAELDRALIAYAPRLSSSIQYTRLSSIGSQSIGGMDLTAPLDRIEIQQSLTIPLMDYALRLPKTHRAAKLTHKAAQTTEKAARLEIAAQARLLYYDWASARLKRAVAEQAVEQARQHLKSASDLFEAGNVSRADVMRVESQVASSELFAAKAQNLESVLEAQLRTLMHDESGRAYEIGEDLRPSPGPGAQPTVEEAYSNRLDLRAANDSIGAAQARSRATFAGVLPHLDAFATLTNARPNSRYIVPKEEFNVTWAAGLQLSFSPNEVADKLAATRSADARTAQAVAQRDALRDSIRNDVTQATEALWVAEFALGSTARGLQAATESHRVRHELFLHGRATSVELTDAETELTQARLDAISARIDHRTAQVRLDHATGRDAGLIEGGTK